MTALSKPRTDLSASRPVPSLTIVALFSLVGLVLSMGFAYYCIDIALGL
jgi:hypothetical protein